MRLVAVLGILGIIFCRLLELIGCLVPRDLYGRESAQSFLIPDRPTTMLTYVLLNLLGFQASKGVDSQSSSCAGFRFLVQSDGKSVPDVEMPLPHGGQIRWI